MQYTVRIHEIVITIHCDSGASYDFAKLYTMYMPHRLQVIIQF